MFKKLKDKLAEEVKSSPQRIQQFAQAAQAAVTSASSSISDITNNDLFSITDNDNPQNNAGRSQPSPKQQSTFQDVSLTQSTSELANYGQDMETPRQRKLSNSSFASDISFRLPSYETPSTYHLQSDMEVSASEADERGFSGGPATLDRVTKEQLYSAYKRTQERYTKYRNQYGDLARHYKLLERENAKARSVLVETQDKALRRISELKEQCTLEQSAKAHLEKALRIEIEEKALKIEALNTKVTLLQNTDNPNTGEVRDKRDTDNDVPLINLASDSTPKPASEEPPLPDVTSLNNKIEKMEQLLNKYKESLKMSKDKNSQITVELQILSNDIDMKNKQIQEFKIIETQLNEANNKIKQLNDVNEELQNQINAHDFTKIKELSTLELDLQKATEEITELRSKIDVFSKREEDYAISLAENKLSIHKELEGKEAEIKSLKDSLAASKQENQSMKIVLDDYKNNLLVLEGEKEKLVKDSAELMTMKVRIDELNLQIQELTKKCQSLEQLKSKADEEYKCLQLQHKQETAEKLAMIDRNVYLEGRNTQLSEENMNKSSQITSLENELQNLSKNITDASAKDESEATNLLTELMMWKEKCETLESEIQEEREELVKLQTEIEKLLINHELIQSQNVNYRTTISNLTADNLKIHKDALEYKTTISRIVNKMSQETSESRKLIYIISNEMQTFVTMNKKSLSSILTEVTDLFQNIVLTLENKIDKLTKDYEDVKMKLEESYTKNEEILAEKTALEAKISKLSDELDTEELALKDEISPKIMAYEQALEDTKTAKSENETLHKRVRDIEMEKHTIEDLLRVLESDKKELTVIVSNLEESLAKINKDFETATRKNEESENVVKSLIKENEELKKNETMESGTKVRIDELNLQIQELTKKCQSREQLKSKADEEYKCLQLQHKQETAEKLAMIDRNVYLEGRNTQLSEENMKKSSQITSLENELQNLSKNITDASAKDESEATNLPAELMMWKEKCETLESEIQAEREELVKLQTEIEKLLINHELIQSQNVNYRTTISNLTADNLKIHKDALEYKTTISRIVNKMSQETSESRKLIYIISNEMQTFVTMNKKSLSSILTEVTDLFQNIVLTLENKIDKLTKDYEDVKMKLEESYTKNEEILAEKTALEAKISKLSDELDTKELALKDEISLKIMAYEQALEDTKTAKSENETLHKRVRDIEMEKHTIEDLLRVLESDKKELTVIVSNLEKSLAKINKDFETATRKNEESENVVKSLIKENEELKKNETMESGTIKNIKCLLETEKNNHSVTIGSLEQMTTDKNDLNEKFQNVEIKNTQLVAQLNEINGLHQAATDKIIEMEEIFKKSEIDKNNLELQVANEKNALIEKLKVVENDYVKCHDELEDLKSRYKIIEKDIIRLNSELNHKSEDYEKKSNEISELEAKCAILSEENIKLKCEAASFTSDINKLESEIDEIKKSHAEIEHEKDCLNIVIENLERKEADQVTSTQTKDTQTDSTPIDTVTNINENSALFENKWVLENKQTAMTNTASLNLKTNEQEDIIAQYTALKINNDALKDDNRRLQSDIEGLQSYLTKISKENSVLNDKLREVIATSEHSMDNDQLSSNINQLHNELQSGKEKINDLLRENSLLVEENLELKDQLNSQNYSKPIDIVNNVNNNPKENENIKEKYDNLLQNTSDMKKQNIDLEQINKSVTNNNNQLQEKNEKLKLSNEKLERRLDEALVSLRHLHSLSENTELEYLKNILYEYLTGTGTHSVTLAKVLAAIVKFDDMQTQMVLQKEKERQGFLRQLGII